jgi:O-acetyl-ADP-ribose deacetylase (regulator of RNase III)
VALADITTVEADAIVNAANERLLGGGGVDGAIHRVAGPELLAACRALPEVRPGVRCATGEACLTPGFRLPARFVIHTVGPVWSGGHRAEDELLASCYASALAVAAENQLRTIAFPAISCGAYGYPIARAAEVAVRAIRAALDDAPDLETVILVANDQHVYQALSKALGAAE